MAARRVHLTFPRGGVVCGARVQDREAETDSEINWITCDRCRHLHDEATRDVEDADV